MKIPRIRPAARLLGATFVVAVLAASAAFFYPAARANRPSAAQEKEAARATDQSTSLNDQTDLNVTVYNSNIALVRDVRNLTLPSGTFRLKFMDIAATVNPATVHFRSLTDPEKLGVIEQNYEYDLLEPAKLLHKYVGKEVTLVRTHQESATTKYDEIKATLLMSLENSGPRKQQVEASYLANNLSWNADYVLTVARDDKNADLDGWVTVTNNSGTGFHNAHLQLVAGELNRVQPPAPVPMVTHEMVAGRAAAPQFQQEAFSEYHLYTLGRKTSVEDKETKQISLLEGSGVPVEKLFVVNGQSYYYRNQQAPGAPLKDPVLVYYKFKNEEKNGLGIPLPAGNVRVYQKDSRGGILFAGEDRVNHTPRDEEIDIHIGNAFDVVAEHKQTDYKHVDTHTWEFEFEVTLRNHKDIPIVVQVNEPIGGEWEMLSSTYKYTKTAAFAAQFSVPVAKDGASVLKYRVRAKW